MYNLFISHAWKYNSEYYNLVDMLNKASYFSWKNYSVPQHDALDTRTDKELDEALHRQISPCSCVLIIAGMYYNQNDLSRRRRKSSVSPPARPGGSDSGTRFQG